MIATLAAGVSSRATLAAGRHDFTLTFNDETGTPQTHYWTLFVPIGYTPTIPWPLWMGWHGSGERFNPSSPNPYAPVDNNNVGLGSWARVNVATITALIAIPQARQTTGFTQAIADYQHNLWIAIRLLVEGMANVDGSRRYAAGLSDTGHRIWWHLYNETSIWAAAAPWSTSLSGKEITNTIDSGSPVSDAAGDALAAALLVNRPIKLVHHTDDVTVPPTRDYATSLAFGGPASAPRSWNNGTFFADLDNTGGHDTWTAWLANSANIAWMESQRL